MADILRPEPMSQHTYPNPGGGPDEQHETDCGETCLASGIAAFRRLKFSPGCYREALEVPAGSGATTPVELEHAIRYMGLMGTYRFESDSAFFQFASNYLGSGPPWCFAALVGYFQGPHELHWVLCYDARSLFNNAKEAGIWAMDPWVGAYRLLSRSFLASNMTGDFVSMHRRPLWKQHGITAGEQIL